MLKKSIWIDTTDNKADSKTEKDKEGGEGGAINTLQGE